MSERAHASDRRSQPQPRRKPFHTFGASVTSAPKWKGPLGSEGFPLRRSFLCFLSRHSTKVERLSLKRSAGAKAARARAGLAFAPKASHHVFLYRCQDREMRASLSNQKNGDRGGKKLNRGRCLYHLPIRSF